MPKHDFKFYLSLIVEKSFHSYFELPFFEIFDKYYNISHLIFHGSLPNYHWKPTVSKFWKYIIQQREMIFLLISREIKCRLSLVLTYHWQDKSFFENKTKIYIFISAPAVSVFAYKPPRACHCRITIWFKLYFLWNLSF